jgi:putative NADH-flavin reductase
LAVIGAAGRIGSRIVAEAIGRGHRVTAVVRDPSRGTGDVVRADVFDAGTVATAVSGADVVVNAAGHAAQLADAGFYTRAAVSVVAALRTLSPPPRLIVVGGFGSLLGPDGQQYADRPGLPPQAAPEIVGQRDALTFYRGIDDVEWTYVSPPPGGIAPGERTGSYQVAVDTIGDRDPSSTLISMEDYAIAVLDEAERAEHPHACIVAMR